MKKSHILIVIMIAASLGVILAQSYNSATYGNFAEAFNNSGDKYTVVGHLNKNKEVVSEANMLEFYMLDKQNNEYKVYLNETMPQNFMQSESIVIEGKANADNNTFYATSILMKCPSKYNENAKMELSIEGK